MAEVKFKEIKIPKENLIKDKSNKKWQEIRRASNIFASLVLKMKEELVPGEMRDNYNKLEELCLCSDSIALIVNLSLSVELAFKTILEYQGKKTGDDIGEMLYHYGQMYGNAFIVVECIGGVGDATVLSLMRLGYNNLYYDDPMLKTYTIQREASTLGVTNEGKLPGFHSSSVRFQMLTHFADMVRRNQLKIRSKRVITELDTWIYKGEAGRIDHMDGCHDDTLTCMAMGLFVMTYSLEKLQKAKQTDAAIISSWTTGNTTNIKSQTTNKKTVNNYMMPYYTTTSLSNYNTSNTPISEYGWLFYGINK